MSAECAPVRAATARDDIGHWELHVIRGRRVVAREIGNQIISGKGEDVQIRDERPGRIDRENGVFTKSDASYPAHIAALCKDIQ